MDEPSDSDDDPIVEMITVASTRPSRISRQEPPVAATTTIDKPEKTATANQDKVKVSAASNDDVSALVKRPHGPASLPPAKRHKIDVDSAVKRTQERSPVDSRTPPPSRRTITFDEVYQGGKPKHAHYIIRYSNKWWILKCDEHELHFASAYPAHGAAKHLNGAAHGHMNKSHALAFEILGWEVVDCTAEKARQNNAMSVTKHAHPAKGPRGSVAASATKAHPANAAPAKAGPGATSRPSLTRATPAEPQESRPKEASKPGVSRDAAAIQAADGQPYAKEGELYWGIWYGGTKPSRYPVLILGWRTQEKLGYKKDTYIARRLLDRAPGCYVVSDADDCIAGWAPGYEDGGPLVNNRSFPVVWLDFPPRGDIRIEDCKVSWLEARHLRPFNLFDPNRPKSPMDRSNRAREYVARLRGFESFDAMLANVGSQDTSSPTGTRNEDSLQTQKAASTAAATPLAHASHADMPSEAPVSAEQTSSSQLPIPPADKASMSASKAPASQSKAQRPANEAAVSIAHSSRTAAAVSTSKEPVPTAKAPISTGEVSVSATPTSGSRGPVATGKGPESANKASQSTSKVPATPSMATAAASREPATGSRVPAPVGKAQTPRSEAPASENTVRTSTSNESGSAGKTLSVAKEPSPTSNALESTSKTSESTTRVAVSGLVSASMSPMARTTAQVPPSKEMEPRSEASGSSSKERAPAAPRSAGDMTPAMSVPAKSGLGMTTGLNKSDSRAVPTVQAAQTRVTEGATTLLEHGSTANARTTGALRTTEMAATSLPSPAQSNPPVSATAAPMLAKPSNGESGRVEPVSIQGSVAGEIRSEQPKPFEIRALWPPLQSPAVETRRSLVFWPSGISDSRTGSWTCGADEKRPELTVWEDQGIAHVRVPMKEGKGSFGVTIRPSLISTMVLAMGPGESGRTVTLYPAETEPDATHSTSLMFTSYEVDGIIQSGQVQARSFTNWVRRLNKGVLFKMS